MSQMPTIARDMTVEQLLTAWPQTARVFLDRRMACVGCPVAAFETIEEVAAVYEQDPETLIAALKRCALEQGASGHAEVDESDGASGGGSWNGR